MAIRWVPVEAGADRATRAAQQMPLHPSLPKIRDSGLEGDLAWVAMDFPEGRLFSSVGPAEATPEWLRRVGADIAEALATLHAQGIVHGEVGSDSILLVDGRTAILWDAPLVVMDRLTDRRGGERRLAALRRKALFVAPECARGDDPTEASDVYSLGAVLCLAMGAAPARSTLGTLFAIGSGQWRPTVPASLPEPLAASLARMTSFDPRERPSAAKIAELWRRTTSRAPFEPHFPVAVPAGYVVSDGPRARAEAALTPFPDAGDLQRTERIPERAIDARLAAVDIRLFRAASRQAEAHRLTPADLAAVHPGRAALATIALAGIPIGFLATVLIWCLAPSRAPIEERPAPVPAVSADAEVVREVRPGPVEARPGPIPPRPRRVAPDAEVPAERPAPKKSHTGGTSRVITEQIDQVSREAEPEPVLLAPADEPEPAAPPAELKRPRF